MDSPTPTPVMSAKQVLDREYLEIRAKLLEIAASLDRIDRGPGRVDEEPRLQQFRDALTMILNSSDERAEQLQLIFSRTYEPDWRQTFQLPSN